MTKAVQDLMVEVERVHDAFHTALYEHGDGNGAAALLDPACHLPVVPTGVEAVGVDAIRRHLVADVVPHLPADLTVTRILRTGSRFAVVDESTMAFTHDRELPWLPGVAPTGRRGEVLVVWSVGVRKSRITHHRTFVDHVGLCRSLGLPADAGTAPLVEH